MKRLTYILFATICAISLSAQTISSQNTNETVTTDDFDDSEFYTSATNQENNFRYDTGHFLHFGLGGGLGQVGYSVSGGTLSYYMPSFTTDIRYSYFFLPWLGITSGVDLSYYTSAANLTRRMSWEGAIDSEGESYTHQVDFHNWRERQHEIMVEIPLALSFKVKPNKGGFYFNIGAKAGIPVYANYVRNRGELVHSGYYPQWDVTFENLQDRFETEPLLRAQEGSYYNKVHKINASVFAELGALIQLDPLTDITLGLYANYYVNDHSAIKPADADKLGFANEAQHTAGFMNEYNGLIGTNAVGAIHPWSAGVKIGIQAHILTKAEREAAKNRKAAKEHDLAPKSENIIHDTILLHDTIFVRDTLYMTVHERETPNGIVNDTVWIVRIDTICPDANGQYVNLTQERLRREDEEMERRGYQEPVLTEQGKRAAKKLDSKLTTSVIWFHFDDYKPILEPFDVIDTVAQALLADPDLHVNINGHACKIGTDSYNQRLAMKRAQAVARLLRLKGVPAEQMTVRSIGANEPYRYNGEKHQYSRDRRVEIVPMGADEALEEENKSMKNREKRDINTAPESDRTDIDYYHYNTFIGEEKVQVGSRLAQIARRWYGHWEYWVYIYEANADKIPNPQLIHPGLVVMIPDLTEINEGLTEKEAIEQALEVEKLYIK